MRKVVHIKQNEDGKEFYYINLGAEDHFRPIYRLWVPKRLVRKCENNGELYQYIQFPIKGVRIEKGKKDLILKPGRFNLFYYFVWSGHRGSVEVDINDSEKAVLAYAFRRYESPRASLGVSREIFVLTPLNRLEIGWNRTGFVGDKAKRGVTRIYFENDYYDNSELKIIENAKIETIEDIDLEGLQKLANLLGLNTNTNSSCGVYE